MEGATGGAGGTMPCTSSPATGAVEVTEPVASTSMAASNSTVGATNGPGGGVMIPPTSYSSPWASTNLTSKPEECSSSTEREARSVALEKAYVHDVYQQIACHFSDSRYRAWPRVKQFLLDLEPGSFVCDVGCGNGKYLSINPSIYKIGLDRCSNLANIARDKDHEVMISDCLSLPFRDECFDAGLSIAVIHHFATTERRVAALKELARVLRIGGKLMVSVWAMEQRHRKFESQDVLVPWNRPMTSSSDDKTSSIERDLNSTTTTTSDDDATHYHAYTQTSDSDSFPSMHGVCRKRGRVRHHRGRSIDPTCPSSSQSSSDLSSPNESCYSFVRRALQKLAGTRRNRGGRRPWFLQGLDIATAAGTDEIVGAAEQFGYMDCGEEIGLDYNPHHPLHNRGNDAANSGNNAGVDGGSMSLAENLIPIELRQLESTEYAELFHQTPAQPPASTSSAQSATSKAALIFSNVLYPRRRRTLETTFGDLGHSTEAQSIGAQPKSKSLSDLLGLIPVSLLRSTATHHRKVNNNEEIELVRKTRHNRSTGTDGQSNGERRCDPCSISPLVQSYDDPMLGPFKRHVSVQTECFGERFELSTSPPTSSSSFHLMFPQQKNTAEGKRRPVRPLLVKQKHSICSDAEEEVEEEGEEIEGEGGNDGGNSANKKSHDSLNEAGTTLKIPTEISDDLTETFDKFETNPPEKRSPRESGISPKKISPRDPEFPTQQQPQGQHPVRKLKHQKKSIIPPSSMPFWKQTSMNDELIFSSDRLKEKERLKQQVQKQCSLNEELIYNKDRCGARPAENNRWDQMKDAFLKNSSNVKCFQLIKNGLSRGFRSGGASGGNDGNGQGVNNSSSSSSGVSSSVENGQYENGMSGIATPGINDDTNGSENGGATNDPHGQTVPDGTNGNDYAYTQQSSQSQQNTRFPPSGGGGTTSLRNGIVRMLQNWKQSEDGPAYSPASPGSHRFTNANSGSTTSARRALFPPFFLRRSSAGSLTLVGKQGNKQEHHHHHLNHHGQCSSPGPLSPLGKGVAGEGADLNGSANGSSSSGNKLLPGVRHVRKLSREEGSDSSKDSSFQSDTSVDSEDSFASVIFIPKSGGLDDFGGDFCGTRANSTDSDRSPKSPASRLSPPNHGNMPKSPSPLAQEVQAIMRKRSPEVSPAEQHGRQIRLTPGGSTTSSGFGSSSGAGSASGSGEVTKFLFDESSTTRLLAGDDTPQECVPIHLVSPTTISGSNVPLQPIAVIDQRQDDPITVTVDIGTPLVIVGHSEMEKASPFPTIHNPPSSPPPTTIQIPLVPHSKSSSSKKRVEKIEVLRKPGVVPDGGRSGYTRQLVRRSLPKSLAVELFNPETDDADTSDTSSSSPNSVSSVVSVVNEDSSAGAGGTTSGGAIDEAKQPIITEEEVDEIDEAEELEIDDVVADKEESGPLLAATEEEDTEISVEEDVQQQQENNVRKSSSASILEVAASVVSSLENLVTHSSPKSRRKSTLSKLGSTSEWLSSLEITLPGGLGNSASNQGDHHSVSSNTSSSAVSNRKTTMKSLKKTGQQKSSSEDASNTGMHAQISTDSTTEPAQIVPSAASSENAASASNSANPLCVNNGPSLSVEMMEERDSLFDSMENLTNNSNNSKQQPSRNPSIDSSVRMSSTCSCSIRGGDSFDSWTSAKSSLTNSSCTQPPPLPPLKTSLAAMISLPVSSSSGVPAGSSGTSGIGTVNSFSGGSSFNGAGHFSLGQSSKMSSLDSNGTNNKGCVGVSGGLIGGTSTTASRRRDAQSRIRVQSSSKSSSAAGEDTEDSTALTCHRYYHVFREGELDKLIEKYVQNLHIISSYYDHANWCIIAEKVQVWTI